jgi:hypothetical protein
MNYIFKYKRDEHGMYRPFVKLVLRNGGREEACSALVDSGADYCLFPTRLIENLELSPADVLRRSETEGYGSEQGSKTQFWNLAISIEEKISFTAAVGFSESQNQREWGVLGRNGFFDQFLQVCFHDTYLSVKTPDR